MRSLIPHTGTMCLLDCVEMFDDLRIVCRASSHHRQDNPLRYRDRLSVQAGIEYAAQAVAAHGSLLAQQGGNAPSPRGGMIAVLTDIHWHTDRLDTFHEDLAVMAEKLADLPQGLNYRFSLSAGQQRLLDGELIIALQDIVPAVATPI
jgi:predicted hotdog family 3-hydroxylacyl-ACP dehydratase